MPLSPPPNESDHARVRDELRAAACAAGWVDVVYESSIWMTGPTNDAIRCELASYCRPLRREDISLVSASKLRAGATSQRSELVIRPWGAPRIAPGDATAPLGYALVFEALARHGRARTEEIVTSFVAELTRTRPELGGSHLTKLEPIGVRDMTRLRRRLEAVRGFVDEAFGKGKLGGDGLSIWELVGIEPSFRNARVTVTVVRDEGGEGDEGAAATRLEAALRQGRPDLAKAVVFVGEYCK